MSTASESHVGSHAGADVAPDVVTTDAAPAATAPASPWGGSAGLSALIMPCLLAAFSLFLLIGSLTMDKGKAEFPGPDFVPMLLGAAGIALAIALAVQVVRHREIPEADDAVADLDRADRAAAPHRFHSDFGALAWCFLGFLAFAVLLPFLGWILAGALLFWCVARGFGSPRPVFDILVALFMSSLTYLAFSVVLGLTLPSGILGGGF